MKLVIAVPEYPPHTGGGLAKFYGTLAPAMVRAGCDVTVVVASPFSADFESYEHDGVRVRCVAQAAIQMRADDMSHLSATPVFRRWLAAARASRDLVESCQPDCIETTDFGLQFVSFLASPAPSPVIVQCHGSLGQISEHEPRRPELELDLALARLTEATLLPLADDVQTYSSANASEWTARLGRRVRVVPPPLAPAPAAEAGTRGDRGLVVGRIQSWKGPEVLCQALLRTSDAPPIDWVGRDTATAPDGQSLDAYLRERYSAVWGSRIAVVGPLAADAVAERQRHARVVIVPSTWDVYNLTAVEAMQAARVVVCSDGAGARDLIESGRNGFVFPAGDAAALADTLVEALHLAPGKAEAMGRRAREATELTLNPDANARVHLEAVRSVVSQPARRREAPPDWVQAFFAGQVSGRVSPAFLDQMSLKDLSRYLGKRAGARLLSRSIGRTAVSR
jgi:glycosyltransferase involved in cell wall biosynthesis